MGAGMPAFSAFTTWLCLRMWGVTFLQESFYRRETTQDPGLFCQAVDGPENRFGAQIPGSSAGEEPFLVGPAAKAIVRGAAVS
jgi:hypothetical protein